MEKTPSFIKGAAKCSRAEGNVSVIYAGEYLNKINGDKIERECLMRLREGCRALILNFSDTSIVNSIGVSILLGVIDAAEETDSRLCFCSVNNHTGQLFEMLGLTRHVHLAPNEEAALTWLNAAKPVHAAPAPATTTTEPPR